MSNRNSESGKYHCDQCEFKTSKINHFISHLNWHIKSIHKGVKYVCDQCDFETKSQIELSNHIKVKH